MDSRERTPEPEETASPSSGEARDPERLAECMATLLKFCGIYPENHPRVVDRANAFAAELDAWVEAPNWVAVRIRGEALAVQRLVLSTKNPLVQWMIGRLREAGLAGVEFAKVDAATVIEFARALAMCNARQGRTFATVWPQNHARVRPLELVFGGRHGAGGSEAKEVASSSAVGTAAQDAWKLDLVARLAQQDGVATRLRAIESTAAQLASPADRQATASIDLVSSIVDLLPVEVAVDPERVDDVVTEVLDAMQLNITRVLRDGGEVNDADLLRAALSVAKKYFGKSAGDVPLQKELPTGRPEDERITADLELLLGEVAALPDASKVVLPSAAACEPSAPALAAELCGVYLHVLQHTDRPESLAALANCLPKVIQALGPAAVPILDRYLRGDRSSFEDAPSDASRMRLLTFLERAGLGEVVRSRGYCDIDLLTRTLPDSLPTLARLLGQSEAGIEDLRRALSAVPTPQVVRGAERLRNDRTLFDPVLVSTVVAIGGPIVLPLVQRMLASDDSRVRTAVVGYLRTLQLPEFEAAALRFLEPPTELPTRYVEDLCRMLGDATANDQRLRQMSGHLLRSYVQDPRRRLERRIAAVLGLRFVPGPETRTTLRRLASEGRYTQWGAGPRAMRRQAREILQWMDDRGQR